MNKVETYKYKKKSQICITDEGQAGFVLGFDAAMDLQLPVKFAEWKDRHVIKRKTDDIFTLIFGNDPRTFTYDELYTYWLENVYQIDTSA